MYIANVWGVVECVGAGKIPYLHLHLIPLIKTITPLLKYEMMATPAFLRDLDWEYLIIRLRHRYYFFSSVK